jgi:hypothetical protein
MLYLHIELYMKIIKIIHLYIEYMLNRSINYHKIMKIIFNNI